MKFEKKRGREKSRVKREGERKTEIKQTKE